MSRRGERILWFTLGVMSTVGAGFLAANILPWWSIVGVVFGLVLIITGVFLDQTGGTM